ncbi:MAG: VTT domain-containing protein [Chloroflexi bacterium]|nr:VTT domain-containing protein [Chloroflexota bacterium]
MPHFLEAVFRLVETGLSTPGGLAALFVIVTVGEAGFATPVILEGVFLTAGIHLAHGSPNQVFLFALTVPASIAGASAVYWSSRSVRAPFHRLLVKLPGLSAGRLERASERARGASAPTVALLRLLPGLLVPVSIVAGASRLPFRTFVVGVALSDLVWNGTFLALGTVMGRLFPREQAAHAFWWGALIGITVGLGLAVAAWLVRARTRQVGDH